MLHVNINKSDVNITYFACRGQKLATLSYTYFDIPQDTYLFLEWCDIRTHDENERELDKLPGRNKDHFRVSTDVIDSQKRFEFEKSVIFLEWGCLFPKSWL